MSRKTEQRQKEILELLYAQEEIKASDLTSHFHVSMETIRKDLFQMSEQNLLIKTHGGAKKIETYSEIPIDKKINENASDKKEIARKALHYIQDGSVLFLDPGSTTLALTKFLPLKKNLTIMTNSLMIANQVSHTKHTLIFLGGRITKKGKAAVGLFTNKHIDAITIDLAFMGSDGFYHCEGPTTFSFDEMEVKKHVLSRSKQKILLADASKFHKSGTYTYAYFSDFDYLITHKINSIERKVVQGVQKIIV